MSLKWLPLFGVFVLIQMVVPRTTFPPHLPTSVPDYTRLPSPDPDREVIIIHELNGFEVIDGGKKALVVVLDDHDKPVTWQEARNNCSLMGGDLFSADRFQDSEWLAGRIHDEQLKSYRPPFKFWVGLVIDPVIIQFYHGLHWTSGADYEKFPKVAGVPYSPDCNYKWAWAAPVTSSTKIIYQFETSDAVARAYVCQKTKLGLVIGDPYTNE